MNSEMEALFDAARRLNDPAQRRAFLDAACRQNGPLRQELEELLALQTEAQALLDGGAAAAFYSETEPLPRVPAALMACSAVSERIGDRIGRYKLLEKIGEGGCGVVYMAEQEEPVRRRVALKVIKLGMDTKQVIARFEAERQALAMMDHPNIAKVLDAGATETGRPYFVMELVRGIKITELLRPEQSRREERLELFIQVCHAVQHAHQKGHHSPRPQALEHPGHGARRRAGAESDRFRHRQSHRSGALTDKTLFTRSSNNSSARPPT